MTYTLTNINISERERELATLMVLGYQDREVAGYIYREIYITSSIGMLCGIPFGALVCLFIFQVMGFGSVAGISWFVWILAPPSLHPLHHPRHAHAAPQDRAHRYER